MHAWEFIYFTSKKKKKDYKGGNKQKPDAKHKLDWIKFKSPWT